MSLEAANRIERTIGNVSGDDIRKVVNELEGSRNKVLSGRITVESENKKTEYKVDPDAIKQAIQAIQEKQESVLDKKIGTTVNLIQN